MTERSVAYYSRDVVGIVHKAYPRNIVQNRKTFYGLLGTGTALSAPTVSLYFDPIYHATGGIAAIANRVIDDFSTIRAIAEFDRRFFEYGLDEYYGETNPNLPKHVTYRDIIRYLPSEIFAVALCSAFPPFGYGLALSTIPVYAINSASRREIRAAKKVGDVVKAGLNDGMRDEEIRIMLGELKNMDKDDLRMYLESYK